MGELYLCPKCKETYFIYDNDSDKCNACGLKLEKFCEWCNSLEKSCHCKKDLIEHQKAEEIVIAKKQEAPVKSTLIDVYEDKSDVDSEAKPAKKKDTKSMKV